MLRGTVASLALLASVLAVGFAQGGAAAAKPPKPAFDGAIELSGTQGYRLLGFVSSDGGVGRLVLIVEKRGESAFYVASGEGTANGVDIDLGPLGKIDVEVRPTGTKETFHEGCDGRGKAITIPASELVGTIDFRGEEGFTEAETTHTPLLVEPLLDLVCGDLTEGKSGGSGVDGIQLTAKAAAGPSLTIVQNHLGARVFYRAKMHEREGTVRVSRTVQGHLSPSALRFDPALASASFSAASPFTGSATYDERTPPTAFGPGRGVWRGSLKVDFPGHANVRLAGPGFKASIVHAERTESHEQAPLSSE